MYDIANSLVQRYPGMLCVVSGVMMTVTMYIGITLHLLISSHYYWQGNQGVAVVLVHVYTS